MRDIIKTKDYFNKFIEEEQDDIDFYLGSLNSGKTKPDRIETVKKQIFFKRYGIIIAMYSRGDDIISIRECFTELLEGEIFVSNLHNRYVDFLWLFSIGILLEMDDVLLKRLIYLVERDNLNDRLIDFLIEFRYSEWNGKSTSFLHDNPYKAFDQIINTNKLAATERLKQYLEKEWYKGHNDIGWYESHKSKENIYSGYWSFESAAIVKIMELDDSSFKDNIYYPYDLVHWK